jgi:5-methylcytosine-specific restriction endonuclease McrA
MLTSALRMCSSPGCRILVAKGSACPACRDAARARWDSQRPNSSRRGYGAGWAALRKSVILEERVCFACGLCLVQSRLDTKGQTVEEPIRLLACVDHVDGLSDNRQRANLRAMCTSCHNARTMRDQVRQGMCVNA